ncbi:MAG: glutamate 5-kinase [Anaerolineae bacterium]|nr:glutamate 5-kinase [Anaerolineae bacterium]
MAEFSRIVVKLGSNVLSAGGDHLDRARMIEIVREVAQLHRQGVEVVIVTSGAVLAGRERMGQWHANGSIPIRQMLAAVGQGRLMQLYEQFFDIYGIHVAQILLTADDFRHRRRYLNARDTLLGLIDAGVVPIINENDTVTTDEIKVGDNDNLAALVLTLVDADLLVLLSDIEGLYTADPRGDPTAQLIAEVAQVDAEIWALAGSAGSHGTGGMRTKLEAAQTVQRAGSTLVIASGDDPGALGRVVRGERVGTRFGPLDSSLAGRQRWILAGSRALGRVYVDAGAARALCEGGKSLLAVGVTGVEGEFERGETVRVYAGEAGSPGLREIARGVVRYGAEELEQIKGLKSGQIATCLGYDYGDEVVHRNDMVILGT